MISIPINIAIEDELSEDLVAVLINQSGRPFLIGSRFRDRGFGYLKRMIEGFNNASKGMPYLVVTDLDESVPCAPIKISNWLPNGKNHNLIFRIAVHEVESWIMADREEFASLLRIESKVIPKQTDQIPHAKEFLLERVRKCPNTNLKRAILPPPNSVVKIGPGYNSVLGEYVLTRWSAERASAYSVSLQKALSSLKNFQPVW